MDIVSIIAKKRDGLSLTPEDIAYFVRGAVAGRIADYQITALLMAIRIQGLDREETLALTREMTHSGAVADLSHLPGQKADKHSTGGVGDKTSLVLMPIAAAAGLIGAKMSGRGLGHTGGTLDKLEAIPGFCCGLSVEQFERQLREVGLAIISQTADLVPADKLFYALRDVTATVDSIPLIAASIMSKKLATGANVLVLDVKYGSGAVIPEPERCRELARIMVDLAHDAGMRASALITSMDQPLGRAVGNALEVGEAVEVLQGHGPQDLRDICLALAGEQLYLAGLRPGREQARQWAAELLDSGAALEKFRAMVRAQGGDDDFSHLPQAQTIIPCPAARSGWLEGFEARQVGLAAMLLGAGRRTKTDRIDPAVGLVLAKKCGDRLEAGETLAWLHCNDLSRVEEVKALLNQAIHIGDDKTAPPPLISGIVE